MILSAVSVCAALIIGFVGGVYMQRHAEGRTCVIVHTNLGYGTYCAKGRPIGDSF